MGGKKSGFAVMDATRQREIARKGGKAAHAAGTAHEWTVEEAREAGRKGGLKSHGGRSKTMHALSLLVMVASCRLASAAPLKVTDVSVNIGGTTYTSASVGWHFPVMLGAGDDLILTQNGNPCHYFGFCFDTSDTVQDPVLGVSAPRICVTANGVQSCFDDVSRILTAGGSDNGYQNEYHAFALSFLGPDYNVELGYADNDHVATTDCGRCLPWLIRAGTTFEGLPSDQPGSIYDASYDAGAIRITPLADSRSVDPVPEPTSLFLLGVGLLCVVTMLRRRVVVHRAH